MTTETTPASFGQLARGLPTVIKQLGRFYVDLQESKDSSTVPNDKVHVPHPSPVCRRCAAFEAVYRYLYYDTGTGTVASFSRYLSIDSSAKVVDIGRMSVCERSDYLTCGSVIICSWHPIC